MEANVTIHVEANITNILKSVTIHVEANADILRWKLISSGELSLRYAYLFHRPAGNAINWSRHICIVTSVCSLCQCSCEPAFHLFCSCKFAARLWSWLGSKLNVQID